MRAQIGLPPLAWPALFHRLWTHGFDLYAPCTHVLFHVSGRRARGGGEDSAVLQVYDSQRTQLKFWQVGGG